jgi:hypothetical protein
MTRRIATAIAVTVLALTVLSSSGASAVASPVAARVVTVVKCC